MEREREREILFASWAHAQRVGRVKLQDRNKRDQKIPDPCTHRSQDPTPNEDSATCVQYMGYKIYLYLQHEKHFIAVQSGTAAEVEIDT